MSKILMPLVLNAATWLRGEGPLESYLLRPADGKMCCLGFYCMGRGVEHDRILGRKYPSFVLEDMYEYFRGCEDTPRLYARKFSGIGGDREGVIATINDNALILRTPEGDAERLRRLTPLFEDFGVKLSIEYRAVG